MTHKKIAALLIISVLLGTSCVKNTTSFTYETITVNDAPFAMDTLKIPLFPAQDFTITNYGAIADDATRPTEASATATSVCPKAAGGRVVISSGEWLTGPLHSTTHLIRHPQASTVTRSTDSPATSPRAATPV